MKNTPLLIIALHCCCFYLNAQVLNPWLKSTSSDNINISSRFFGGTYAEEHFYLVGEYWRDIAFDDYALSMLPSDKSHNGFIAKMNTMGETVDLFDVSGYNLQRTTQIEVANDGTLWVSGLFREEMIYDFNTVEAQGYFESFLLHLSSEGELLGRYHFPVLGMYDGVSLYNIEMDLNGNLWLAFSFLGDFVFDGIEYTGGINQDGLIVQMSPEGEILRSHYFAVSEDTEEPPPLLFLDMEVDTDNNLILAGTLGFQFSDFIIFENETLNGSLSFADMAIARISPLGTPQWIELFLHGFNPGTNGGVYPISVQLLEEQLLVGGFFDDRIIHNGETIIDGVDQQLGYILNMSITRDVIDSWMLSSPSYTRINTVVTSPQGLWFGGEYYNAIELEGTAVNSPASALFYGMLSADQIVANEKLKLVEGITVFPNPVFDQLQISGLPNEEGILIIRDMMGRFCASFTTASSEVAYKLDFLTTGYYLWEWQNKEKLAKGSFIKI